jgi:hypothetical protein
MQPTAGSYGRALALGAAVLLALIPLGCGGQNDYHNQLRPAAPINITAYISNSRVSVSPTRFGAGPIVVIATNQSDSSQELTFETDELGGSRPGITQSTVIGPGGTGQLKLDARSGTYRIRTADNGIRPARVVVGRKRPSAQNQVLQP